MSASRFRMFNMSSSTLAFADDCTLCVGVPDYSDKSVVARPAFARPSIKRVPEGSTCSIAAQDHHFPTHPEPSGQAHKAKPLPSPPGPSKAEIETPYPTVTSDKIPVIQMEPFVGTERHRDKSVTFLRASDVRAQVAMAQMAVALLVPFKCVSRFALAEFKRFIHEAGRTPAVLQVCACGVGWLIMRVAPTALSQSQGGIERSGGDSGGPPHLPLYTNPLRVVFGPLTHSRQWPQVIPLVRKRAAPRLARFRRGGLLHCLLQAPRRDTRPAVQPRLVGHARPGFQRARMVITSAGFVNARTIRRMHPSERLSPDLLEVCNAALGIRKGEISFGPTVFMQKHLQIVSRQPSSSQEVASTSPRVHDEW